jgi:ABC-type multidrug transport system permease subunit
MTMNISFNAIQNVILIFPDERPVFLREVNNNMYKCSPYFWAKVISEMPFSIMMPSIFGCIVYFSVGLNPDAGRFFLFLLILILIYNASSGYSLVISCTFSDKQLAVTLTPVLIIPFMLFAGFFVAASNIPVWLREFEYLSIFKYGYQSLMHNQFDGYLDIYASYQAAGCPPQEDPSTWNTTYAAECPTLYNELYYSCLVLGSNGGCSPLSQIS